MQIPEDENPNPKLDPKKYIPRPTPAMKNVLKKRLSPHQAHVAHEAHVDHMQHVKLSAGMPRKK